MWRDNKTFVLSKDKRGEDDAILYHIEPDPKFYGDAKHRFAIVDTGGYDAVGVTIEELELALKVAREFQP